MNSGDWLFHWSYIVVGEDGVPTLKSWQGHAAV
jgi:hypothetical protein